MVKRDEEVISRLAVYTVKKNKVKSVARAVKEFVNDVNRKERGTLMYVAFQKKNSPSEFIHFMVFKNKKAEKMHTKTKHVKKFVDIIYPNSSKEPVFIDLNSLK